MNWAAVSHQFFAHPGTAGSNVTSVLFDLDMTTVIFTFRLDNSRCGIVRNYWWALKLNYEICRVNLAREFFVIKIICQRETRSDVDSRLRLHKSDGAAAAFTFVKRAVPSPEIGRVRIISTGWRKKHGQNHYRHFGTQYRIVCNTCEYLYKAA
jgi:hypothetical protein